ncbi:aminopeptidase N-like [Anopheles ziemanni]|uniref:aminopeptidase N-like n=1 Tax=Anopheles ziemanni TaxID=345580 RepID=UPI00265DDFB4|nr:aminopeptidase N-like [Anopheles ziemanni]
MLFGRSSLALLVLCTFAVSLEGLSHPRRLDRSKLNLQEEYSGLKEVRVPRVSSQYRLPNETTPESYVLELHSNIHQRDFTYTGTVTVQILVLQATRSIVLNSRGVGIVSVSVHNANQNVVPIEAIDVDPERELLTIRTNVEFAQGARLQLTIRFENVLRDDVSGFFRASYYAEGVERFAAITQFQPVDARTAFPCYDEPGIRATFTIIINSGVDMKVHSNMPVASVKIIGNGIKQTRFQTTPRMPTYLVAFAITDGFLSTRTTLRSPPSTINMEVLAPPGTTASAQAYGLTSGAAAIRAVEQYFNQTYDLPKLDQLAVPALYFGAMENWGLVIYAEPYLLYDEATGTNRDKENVIATIVHEFVHQLLGNLLTPHWWSDLFLSEGFATLYEYYLTSELEPSIRFRETFTIEALQTALLVDSNINIRPISYEVDTRRDVERMFDIISYQKAGSVLRMFHHALGERTFQKGMRRYINTNKDKSVTPDDLFASLQSAAQEDAVLPVSYDVASLMRPWIYQSGYPLVTVELHGDELVFRQEHYLNADITTSSDRTWWIPIAYDLLTAGTTQRKQLWIPQGTSQVTWPEPAVTENTLILLNPHQIAYYRVNYDVNLWERLIRHLISDPTSIPPASRGQLLDDCFKLFQTERNDATILFSLLQYIGQEVDAIPWTVALAADNLGVLQGALIPDRSAYEAFATFVAAQITNVFNLVRFDAGPDDAHELQQLRSTVIEWSCRMGLAACRTVALSRMLDDFTGAVSIPAYLKRSVYCGGATIASLEQLEALWLRLETVTDYRERAFIIDTLACAEDATFLDALLLSILERPTMYLSGEWEMVLTAVYQQSAIGYDAVDHWLSRNFLDILQSIASEPAFLDILADIERRADNIGRYYELIQLLKLLQLETYIDRGIFEYTGTLQIEIKVVKPTDQIVLHSVRSVIKSLKLLNSVQNQIPIKGYVFDKEKEFLVINVGEVVQPTSGTYMLDIAFTNTIDRYDRAGFYRSSYVSANGTTRHLGLTQFEPIDARTAFPCYDEPGIKATFEIVVTCGLEYHVRSNTPGKSTVDGDRKIFKFEKTPPMQTYLVAWLVSDFVGEEATLPQTMLTVATWAKPQSANLLTFSVNASKRFIPVMERYFNERYSLSKIDNVAIPDSDYANGAMENWGLVTYRESMVLFDPLKHGFSRQVVVVETIAHEYIHQFFGNLLAPKWWSFLWLNEGLARFYECYIGSLSHPDLIHRELFVADTMQKAFNVDKWPNVIPMTHYDETRHGIKHRFNNVVYDKAASVLRMMHYALGERTFQKGLRYYLQQNKPRGVVEESNLFDSLDQAAKEDKALPANLSMHEIFGSWSNQAGVPIVSVRRNRSEFYFTQTRYYAEPQEDPLNSSWWIPISFSTQSNTAYEKLPAFWMPPHISEVSYSIPLAEGETVTFNPHSTGYYRISYEEPLLDELIQRLTTDHGSIQPAARARLIDDTLNIAYRDGGDYSAALKLMSYLRDETDYVPWVVAYENLRYLKTMLRGDAKASEMLQTFTEQLAAPLLEKYSFAKRSHESANDEELRSIAIELACSASESCKSAENFYNANDRALVCSGLRLARADERNEIAEKMSRAPSVVSAIDYKLQANRKWIDRNVKPLTAALSQILAQ